MSLTYRLLEIPLSAIDEFNYQVLTKLTESSALISSAIEKAGSVVAPRSEPFLRAISARISEERGKFSVNLPYSR